MGDRKLRYWEEGASALRRLGGPHDYLCPLCLHLFPRERIGELSLDHVPPRSIGGKLEVLACRTCNSTAGHDLDAHAQRFDHLRRLAAGEAYAPVPATFTFDGVTANMELRSDQALHNEIVGLAECNPPGTFDRVREVFAAHAAAATAPSIEFTLPTRRLLPRRAEISYLRAGYLAAFAAFGYSAVAMPSFDIVRRQIMEPDAKHLAHFIQRHDQLDQYEVAVIEEPAWHCCILVVMGRFRITLPLRGDAGLYDRIAEAAAARERVRLHGRRMGWPTRPRYARDHAIAASRGAGRLTPASGQDR